MSALDRLARIEAQALAVHAAAGLPTAPGHYRKGPRARKWIFLGEALSPDQRWSLALEHPAGSGWRFRERAALGLDHRDCEVAGAARRLVACADLRARLAAGAISGADADVLIAALEG